WNSPTLPAGSGGFDLPLLGASSSQLKQVRDGRRRPLMASSAPSPARRGQLTHGIPAGSSGDPLAPKEIGGRDDSALRINGGSMQSDGKAAVTGMTQEAARIAAACDNEIGVHLDVT